MNPRFIGDLHSCYQHRSFFFPFAPPPALSKLVWLMESTSSRVNVPNSGQSSKRLLFDRRYGWVIDEWKGPAEEALDGGRGMFCIFPLAKALVQMASQSINLTAISARKASEKLQLFSHHTPQSALDDGVQNFIASLKNIGCKGFILKNSQSLASNSSSQSHRKQ